MDEAGFHANRRAAHEDAYYATHLRPVDGKAPHNGVEWVLPMNEAWVGPKPGGDLPAQELGNGQANANGNGTGLAYGTHRSEGQTTGGTNGFEQNAVRPPVAITQEQAVPNGTNGDVHHDSTHGPPSSIPIQAINEDGVTDGASSNAPQLTNSRIAALTGGNAGASGVHHSVSEIMRPHLQLLCGPLLSYYTTIKNVWHGAAMVVVQDSGSVLTPVPTISLESRVSKFAAAAGVGGTSSVSPRKVEGQQIYTYHGPQGAWSFWRFMIQIPLQEFEQAIMYRLNGGAGNTFIVPAYGQNMRWMAHSCNGFSAGVDTDAFKTDKHDSGFDPLWVDVLEKHNQFGYHCMVGGGDQLYSDGITKEPELQPWIRAVSPQAKLTSPLTDEVKFAIDRYYVSHYCKMFRSGAFGKANGCIPMVNMLDDHDLIDGFGSYDDETMRSPIFRHIGSRGYFFFLLFQLFTVDELDGANPKPGAHPIPSMIVGGEGPYIPSYNHSLSCSLGPQVHMLLLDCRGERKLDEICSKVTYQRVFDHLRTLPPTVEQLVFQLGVPIAYPRMSFVEHFLDSKLNPLNLIGRLSPSGLGGFSNKFNKDAELLDDLNDHWCAKHHKKERNWFVLEGQKLAKEKRMRVTYLSGDVHCAAVGLLHTYYGHRGEPKEMDPSQDYRYMINVITSAIVNTPPPTGAQMMVSFLASNKHRTLHKHHTDETMMPLFKEDTDGKPSKSSFIMGKRNYCSVGFDAASGNLNFDIRVEVKQGYGETKGYGIIAPPPRWT